MATGGSPVGSTTGGLSVVTGWARLEAPRTQRSAIAQRFNLGDDFAGWLAFNCRDEVVQIASFRQTGQPDLPNGRERVTTDQLSHHFGGVFAAGNVVIG